MGTSLIFLKAWVSSSAVHLGHGKISDDEVRAGALKLRQPLQAVSREQHLISTCLQ